MKINNDRGVIPLDTARKQERAETTKSTESAATSKGDSVDARVSQALKNALDEISSRSLNAGEVHGQIDEERVGGLLNSFAVEAKRPKLDADGLNQLADKVASEMKGNPQAAVQAFNDFDSSRVADLISA